MANGTLAASQIEMLSQSGTGIITITPPATNSNRSLALPDAAGTLTTSEAVTAAGYTTPSAVLTQFNATGSAPVYACRAWVNFNGTGTVAIRASGNVSSITDNGTGDYTVNFTTAMPDANYCVQGTSGRTTSDVAALTLWQRFDQSSTSAVRVNSTYSTSNNQGLSDFEALSVAIFR